MLDDVGEALAGRALHVLRGLVVLDGEEADALVARELQRRDAGHVGLAFDGSAVLVIAALFFERALLGGEDERRRVARLRREALAEEVERLLGLRPGRAEGVDERAAAERGCRADGDEDRGDDREGAFPMPRGRSGETSK